MDESLQSRLVQARSMLGWSQQQLAEASGVAAAQISRYELGRSTPRTEVLAKLAQAMNVPLGWLLHDPQLGNPFPHSQQPMDGFEAALRASGAGFDRAALGNSDPIKPQSFIPSNRLRIDPQELGKLVDHLAAVNAKRRTLITLLGHLEAAGIDVAGLASIQSELGAVDKEIAATEATIRALVQG